MLDVNSSLPKSCKWCLRRSDKIIKCLAIKRDILRQIVFRQAEAYNIIDHTQNFHHVNLSFVKGSCSDPQPHPPTFFFQTYGDFGTKS